MNNRAALEIKKTTNARNAIPSTPPPNYKANATNEQKIRDWMQRRVHKLSPASKRKVFDGVMINQLNEGTNPALAETFLYVPPSNGKAATAYRKYNETGASVLSTKGINIDARLKSMNNLQKKDLWKKLLAFETTHEIGAGPIWTSSQWNQIVQQLKISSWMSTKVFPMSSRNVVEFVSVRAQEAAKRGKRGNTTMPELCTSNTNLSSKNKRQSCIFYRPNGQMWKIERHPPLGGVKITIESPNMIRLEQAVRAGHTQISVNLSHAEFPANAYIAVWNDDSGAHVYLIPAGGRFMKRHARTARNNLSSRSININNVVRKMTNAQASALLHNLESLEDPRVTIGLGPVWGSLWWMAIVDKLRKPMEYSNTALVENVQQQKQTRNASFQNSRQPNPWITQPSPPPKSRVPRPPKRSNPPNRLYEPGANRAKINDLKKPKRRWPWSRRAG